MSSESQAAPDFFVLAVFFAKSRRPPFRAPLQVARGVVSAQIKGAPRTAPKTNRRAPGGAPSTARKKWLAARNGSPRKRLDRETPK
jgi:hypothetical protein